MDIFDSLISGVDTILSGVGDMFSDALKNFVGKLAYIVVSALCSILKIVYNFFAVFAGIEKVEYDGSKQFLINVFFGNKSVNNVYWGMAVLGFLFIFVFAIISVTKKTFDIDNKQQRSLGAILRSSFKGIIIIVALSAVMSMVLNLTNLLVDRVCYIFDNAETLFDKNEHYFTDEQYATMARIYNTIGNYSLNSSYNSRYNLNSCYNAIRNDLVLLENDGIFDFYYPENEKTWQSMLQKLVKARDPRYEVKIDDKETVTVLLDIMNVLRTNGSFYPIDYIAREHSLSANAVSLDRVVFLMGTLDSANNSRYNQNPSIHDGLREPFYSGEKSIYNLDDVSEAFDISITGISYIIIGLLAWLTLKNVTLCIFNCIARIFNLIGLYIIAPPTIATMPLDDGEKFKQWLNATIVQMFGIFGNIIPMRLIIMFIPMILNNSLNLFPGSPTMNILAKALLIVGMIEASNRFSGIVNGILTNSAVYASAHAGNMEGKAASVFNKVSGKMVSAGSTIAGAAATVTGMKTVGDKVGGFASSTASSIKNSMQNHYGLIGATYNWIRGGSDDKSGEKGSSEAENSKAENKTNAAKNNPGPANNHAANNATAGIPNMTDGSNGGNKDLPPNLSYKK